MNTRLIALMLTGAAVLPALAGEVKPFYFFNIIPSRFESYPACDSPEGADHICKAGESGNSSNKLVFVLLRPEKPAYLTSNIWVGVSPDGKPQWMHVDTGGFRVQDEVLEYLKRTYGKPTKMERVRKQNGFGAQVEGIVANWTSSRGYSVDFEGVTDQLDKGEIKVLLPR